MPKIPFKRVRLLKVASSSVGSAVPSTAYMPGTIVGPGAKVSNAA